MGVFFVLSFSAAVLFLGMHTGAQDGSHGVIPFQLHKKGHCAEIVGGRVSDPHSRPYMAAIVRGNEIYCGGTLIQRNWVLTAAHCLINVGERVILGAHSLIKPEKEKQVFQVIRTIYHENYNATTLEHDILLLQLNGRARINRSVQTVPLPTTNEDIRPGTPCLVAGWGKTHTGRSSDVLQEITATIVDRRICKNYYPIKKITTNKLCTTDLNKIGGPCYGDSGGPLICGRVQGGIISYGEYCDVRIAPAVYARLTTAHVQWIKQRIRG